MATFHEEQVGSLPCHRAAMRDDARAQDSAELTGVDCGDWRLAGGLSEVGQIIVSFVVVIC